MTGGRSRTAPTHPWFARLVVVVLASACAEPTRAPSPDVPSAPEDGGAVDMGFDSGDAWVAVDGHAADAVSDAEPSDLGTDGDLDGGELDAQDPDAGLSDTMEIDSSTPDAPDASPTDSGAAPIAIEGFGAAARGGHQPGSQLIEVTSVADDGPGTLREALRALQTPAVITFGVEGSIQLASALLVPSNVTIDGRGRNVVFAHKGLVIAGQRDIIITGLTFEDVGPAGEDAVQIRSEGAIPSELVVVDHSTFKYNADLGSADSTDEAISVVLGSRNVTIQWCRFENVEKVLLFGNGDVDASVDGAITVTVHHNWFHQTGRRHPRARYGHFDVYNNYLDHWHRFSDAAVELRGRRTHGIWCHDGCEMIVEANIFERAPHPNDQGIGVQWPNQASRCAPDPLNAVTKGEFAGTIEDRGAWIPPENESPLEQNVGCEPGRTVFARPYSASVDAADDSLRARIRSEAGDS